MKLTQTAAGSMVDGFDDAVKLVDNYNDANPNNIINVSKNNVVVIVQSDGTNVTTSIYSDMTPTDIGVDLIQTEAAFAALQTTQD